MIRRFLPYPGLAAALFVIWLLLAQSVSPGQLLLAGFVATLATWTTAALGPKSSPVLSWSKALALAGIVILDVLRSNIAVAGIVLSNRSDRRSSFIKLRLEIRNQMALTVLALIITATPGTAWVQYDRSTGWLLIHVFDLVDEDEWVALLKTRYEAHLKMIFEP